VAVRYPLPPKVNETDWLESQFACLRCQILALLQTWQRSNFCGHWHESRDCYLFLPHAVLGSLVNIQTLICRAPAKKEKATEIILCIKDEDVSGTSFYQTILYTYTKDEKDARNSSVAWSKDLKTGAPLICVAGGCAKIKIFEALTGKLRTVCGPELNAWVVWLIAGRRLRDTEA
jgi:hypothetical protein